MNTKWYTVKLPYSISARGLLHYILIQVSFVALSEQSISSQISCRLSTANGVYWTAELVRATTVADIVQVRDMRDTVN